LVPSEEGPGDRAEDQGTDAFAGSVAAPRRLGLQEILLQFLDFRFLTVTRRLEYELEQLLARIHVLEGFEIVFDALTQAITIIRKSESKADAAAKLIGRFGLTELQADAILELKLYRLSRLEIEGILQELAEKRAQAKKLQALLRSDSKRWALVRDELLEIKNSYGTPRLTEVVASVDEPEFQAEDFIVDEDWNVVVSTNGWVKRLREIRDISTTRLREGDSVLTVVAGSTRAAVAFFSNQGGCYVCRVHEVPASTGYGDPVQKLFKLGDGERIVAALCFDPRVLAVPPVDETAVEPEPPYALAVTRRGLGFRFSLRTHGEPSTRAGRKFARPKGDDEVMTVVPLGHEQDPEWIMCASDDGHALAVPVDEIPLLAGAGKGVMVMKLAPTARLLGAVLGRRDLDAIVVETGKGAERSLTLRSIEGTRAGRGSWIVKRDGFARFVPPAVETPTLEER
jgi:DNA gyrase subunit A